MMPSVLIKTLLGCHLLNTLIRKIDLQLLEYTFLCTNGSKLKRHTFNNEKKFQY